ncbi:hypothetical protein [Micromonospora sp. LOL_024]|uniref:hypothetical protein n=1 Tax=Micromonospora sp. LOL_024 TaxID=3345412 RepID=UPI003A8592A2
MESRRGRPTARVWWALPLLLAIVVVPFAPAAAAAPATAAPDETGKYYVVGRPVNGQREYLYSISLVTLGNGNRFREIIDLNRGRRQPDGAIFTDGVELGPGWILVLPRNADGPGVRTGALPAIGPPTPEPSKSTAQASQSAAAPSPSPGVTTRSAPNAEQLPSTAASPVVAAPPKESGQPRLDPNLIRIGAGTLAVLLAVGAVLMLPRRRRQMRSVTLDDGPWPPERHHTPTPAELDALVASITPPVAPPDPVPPDPVSPAPTPQPSGEPGAPVPVGPPPPDWPPLDGALPIGGAPPPPVPLSRPASVVPAGSAQDGEQVVVADLSRPTLPADGDVPYVRAEVRTEAGPIVVRLIGVTTGPSTPAYAWLAEGETAPVAAVPLVLGRRGAWRLQVDLGRAPDVFTLVGDLDECRRLAAAYARQLRAGGVGVGVVGDALGAEGLDDCHRLDGLPEPGEMDADRYVIVTAGLPKGTGIRGLAAATGGRCIPVVIGPVPNGRWTAQLGAGD